MVTTAKNPLRNMIEVAVTICVTERDKKENQKLGTLLIWASLIRLFSDDSLAIVKASVRSISEFPSPQFSKIDVETER